VLRRISGCCREEETQRWRTLHSKSELIGFWTLSIVQYSKILKIREHNVSETGSVNPQMAPATEHYGSTIFFNYPIDWFSWTWFSG
jgi:hypothetical protein